MFLGMVIAVVPLLVMIAGMLCYVLATNPKVVELGRLTFFAGLLVTLWLAARVTLRIG
jgi:hypothetical protein